MLKLGSNQDFMLAKDVGNGGFLDIFEETFSQSFDENRRRKEGQHDFLITDHFGHNSRLMHTKMTPAGFSANIKGVILEKGSFKLVQNLKSKQLSATVTLVVLKQQLLTTKETEGRMKINHLNSNFSTPNPEPCNHQLHCFDRTFVLLICFPHVILTKLFVCDCSRRQSWPSCLDPSQLHC